MHNKNLQSSFEEFCKSNKFEINKKQIRVLKSLEEFTIPRKKFFNLFKKKEKWCFYLYGNVGVGKTMIVNFVYDQLKIKKIRLHFNEFMVKFHDFRHENKSKNSISNFVKILKKDCELIYLDEFQVTNIVDAMILGKLFETIFLENIKIIITTNNKLGHLYKDGLQRDLFIPFIKLIEKNSIQTELFLEDDYRTQLKGNNQKIFYPLNDKTLFNVNQNFRILTKNKKREEKSIITKGRILKIPNYYEGISRFNFKELCDQHLGAEDYLNLSKICTIIFLEEIPRFNETNSNQQLRFITLIDIFYENKIRLIVSMASELNKLGSSKKHLDVFKRTLSRLYEMTLLKNS